VAGEPADGGQRGFLPPEAPGREPDLGSGLQPPQPAEPPPATAQPPGAQQLWQQPAQPWAYRPQPAPPDNGPAVAGFVLSVTSGALLLLSIGLSTIVSVVCAGLGVFYSRRGRARVDRGETPKHRSLAQAGFITGIVSLVLSLLATAFWGALAILAATDDEFRRELEDDLEDRNGIETSVLLGLTAVRLTLRLLA